MFDCSWDNPGVNPYGGTVAAAVARYDLPNEVRAELIRKAARVQFDDVATISKHGITSRHANYSGLRDMHFGRTVCRGPVTVRAWASDHLEYAMIYCSGMHCIAVPFVCRNVSLITPDRPVSQFYERDRFPARPGDPAASAPPAPEVVHTVPEPSTLVLLATALAGMALLRRKT